MRYLLGIDIGTSATKAVLTDEIGCVHASAAAAYPLYQEQPGWAEQVPSDWWDAVQCSIRETLAQSGIAADAISAVGLTGQMHGLVMLDSQGAALRRAILWCDQRTAVECEEINAAVGAARYIQIAANPPLTGFTCPKILWVRKHEPSVYRQCRHILLPKDYIRFCLTDVFASDLSDASGTGLLDVKNRRWSVELLEKLQIPRDWLGQLFESHEITGTLSKSAAALTGLKPGTPVVAGAGDNAAAAVGVGVVRVGSAFTSIGTSGVVFANTADCSIHPQGRVHSFCSAVPGQWYVMGVTQAAGLSLKWFKEAFGESQTAQAQASHQDVYDVLAALAQTVPPGCEGLTYLPYLMGERTPHLDPFARGVFFGLQYGHGKPHFIRAILEGVCFSLLDCLTAIRQIQVSAETMLVCGGGAKSAAWRQILADVFRLPLHMAAQDEGPAMGAALLAGVGVGIYADVAHACSILPLAQTVTLPGQTSYRQFYQLYRSLYPALRAYYPRG